MNKGFPFNLLEKDLLALYNILPLAKGNAQKKTIAQLNQEVHRELERRLNDNGNNDSMKGKEGGD